MPNDLGDPDEACLPSGRPAPPIPRRVPRVLLLGLVVLGLTGIPAYWYGARSGRLVAPVSSSASDALHLLRAENATLTAQKHELRQQLDRLTQERDALHALIADLTEQLPPFGQRRPPAASPQAAASPTPPAKSASATKAPAPKRAARTKPRAMTEGSTPAKRVECSDGRTVANSPICASASAPPAADQLTLPFRYQCGDGSTADDPEECRPRRPDR